MNKGHGMQCERDRCRFRENFLNGSMVKGEAWTNHILQGVKHSITKHGYLSRSEIR